MFMVTLGGAIEVLAREFVNTRISCCILLFCIQKSFLRLLSSELLLKRTKIDVGLLILDIFNLIKAEIRL